MWVVIWDKAILTPSSTLHHALKVHIVTCHEGTKGEEMYTSILSLTSAIEESWWSIPRPGRFTPGNDPAPIEQEAG